MHENIPTPIMHLYYNKMRNSTYVIIFYFTQRRKRLKFKFTIRHMREQYIFYTQV